MSLNDFAVHCGFYDSLSVISGTFNRALSLHAPVHYQQYWSEIIHPEAAQQRYDPRLCKSTNITRPDLRYLHRLIAGTICGRRESTGCVSQKDLFYLRCLDKGITPHLGYGFDFYMDTMSRKSKGALCGGSYIIRLAKNLKVFDSIPHLSQLCTTLPFHLAVLKKIRVVTIRDGQFILIIFLAELGH